MNALWVFSIIMNGTGLIANLCYGRKSKWGPILWTIVSLVWIVYFLSTNQLPLCFGPGTNLVTQVINYLRYSNDEQKEKGRENGKQLDRECAHK